MSVSLCVAGSPQMTCWLPTCQYVGKLLGMLDQHVIKFIGQIMPNNMICHVCKMPAFGHEEKVKKCSGQKWEMSHRMEISKYLESKLKE